MNRHKTSGAQPRRELHSDFTARTIRHAIVAKRRATVKQYIKTTVKEMQYMKSFKKLGALPGAAALVIMVTATSAGAYALTNWFNANVAVNQDKSVMSVNIADCKDMPLSGIGQNVDKRNVQFKILGDPHIAADQLQRRLLAECEYNAAIGFYKNTYPDQNFTFYAGTVKAVATDASVTLDYSWGGVTKDKTFAVSNDAGIFNQGARVTLQDLKAGDTIIFASEQRVVAEGVDPLADVSQVQSIFKTQYDVTDALSASKEKSALYDSGNIMPLEMYNQLHK